MSSPLVVKSVVEIGCCKVCQGEATLYGVTDFNTACYAQNASRYVFPLTGVPIYYHQCQRCGLVYTHAFDDWTPEDYAQHVYNEGYAQFDPNYEFERPGKNRDLILALFKKFHGKKMLDYGGGTGTLARLMQEVGIDMVAWDPFVPGDYPAANSYEFITSFEVLEHTPDPHKTLGEVSGFLKKGGVFFFSTGTTDEVSHLGMNDWYIAPRNGHITIYSEASLNALFEAHGFQITHLNRWSHVAMKMVA